VRWFRICPPVAAAGRALGLLLAVLFPSGSFPSGAAASQLTVGPLQVLAGGGLGEGTAALSTALQPTSVLATDAGLWIADEQFNRVRLVAADGTMRSVVGSGAYGFNGDGQPALRSHLGIVADLAQDAQGRLLLVDLANRQIRVLTKDGSLHTFVDADHPLFTTVAGTFAPVSVAPGPAGLVHVADRGTNVVWQFDADGQGRRAAGDGTRGFSGDGAPSALGQLADPRSVAVGDDGAIWIADTGNGRVRVVAPNGRLWTAAGDGSAAHFGAAMQASALHVGLKPIDIAIGPHGQVFVLDEQGSQLLRLGPAPRFVDGRLVGAETLSVVHRFGMDGLAPIALDVAADGTIYLADAGHRRVLALHPDALEGLITVAGNGTPRATGDGADALNAGLYDPAGMSFADDGTLFFADRLNHLIRRVDTDGTIRSLADSDLGQLGLNEPEDVVFDSQGRAFIADTGNDRVLRIDADGAVVVAAPAAADDSRLRRPTALSFDAGGRLLIADSGHRVVRRLERDGTLTTVAGNGATSPVEDGGPATASAILRPVDIKADSRGELWIADAGAHRVYRLGADGLLRLVAGTGRPGLGATGSLARQSPLHTPTGVEPDGAGGIIIADSGNSRLVHVDVDGVLRLVADAAEGKIGRPTRLATSVAGKVVFSDGLTHRILQLTVQSNIAPALQRIVVDPASWQVQTRAALSLKGLQEVAAHPLTGLPLATSRSSVTAIDGAGRSLSLLGAEADQLHIGAVSPPNFGAALLLVAGTRAGQPKPLTLVRFADGKTPNRVERYDLEFFFEGAGALAVDASGDVLLHQAEDGSGGGRLLRLRHERLLNIPGFVGAVGGQGVGDDGIEMFAALPAGAAALAAAPDGGVYVAQHGTQEIKLVRDLDGDGKARGPIEQHYVGRAPESPVALAVSAHGALFVATVANRVYQLEGGKITLVARGFAPRLIDLEATADGLLVLEGDRSGGRLLALRPARPEVQAWPTTLDFGAGRLGEELITTTVLRNDGSLPVRVTSETTSEQGRAQGPKVGDSIHLAPGEIRQVEARWTPPIPGRAKAALLWRDDDGQVLLNQPVVIHGLAPRVDIAEEFPMGTVWVGGTQKMNLSLHNRGDAELQVQGLELIDAVGNVVSAGQVVSGLGFTARTASTTLNPGEETVISVTLAPARRAQYATTLQVLTDDPLHPRRDIHLRGVGGGATLTITEIDLGTLPVGQRRSQELSLTNTGDLDLRIHSILSGTRQLILTPRWLTVRAGKTETVRIDFAPAAHGELSGELTLLTNDPARPEWTLPFRGLGVSQQLLLSALTHDFGAVTGATRWEFELSNYYERRLQVLDVSTDHSAFHVVQGAQWIDPGTTATYVVEFEPQAQTESRGQVLLRTNLVEAPEVAVGVRGRGRAAGQIRVEQMASPVSLWPDEDLRLPVEVVDAAGLRGAVFTVAPSPGFTIAGVTFPEAGLLRQVGEPLLVMDSHDDAARVGLSLTGSAGVSIDGSGPLAVLHLRASTGPLPSAITVRLSAVVARSASGLEDSLMQPRDVELQLHWKGDLNGDGHLDISDAFLLIDALGSLPTESGRASYDLDGDAVVGVSDVQLLIEHLPASAKTAALRHAALPSQPTLLAPFPNPFNGETVIMAGLPKPTQVQLSVHNLLGQRIRTLRSQVLPAGTHRAIWDGKDDDGQPAGSGVYIVVLDVAGQRAVQRLLLVR
jgi:sugar lactone lactonase YvrE